ATGIAMRTFTAALALATFMAAPAHAEDTDALARRLSNPIASLISVPFQFNAEQRTQPHSRERQHRQHARGKVAIRRGRTIDFRKIRPRSGRSASRANVALSYNTDNTPTQRRSWLCRNTKGNVMSVLNKKTLQLALGASALLCSTMFSTPAQAQDN